MYGLRYLALCTGILAVSLTEVNGISEEEKAQIKRLVTPLIIDCGKEYGVSEEEFKAAKAAGTLKDLDPCLMACFFKKIGVIAADGTFNVNKAAEITKKYLSNEDDQSKALNAIHTCASVNEQSVSDGDKGCDRAKLLVQCYLPFKGFLLGHA